MVIILITLALCILFLLYCMLFDSPSSASWMRWPRVFPRQLGFPPLSTSSIHQNRINCEAVQLRRASMLHKALNNHNSQQQSSTKTRQSPNANPLHNAFKPPFAPQYQQRRATNGILQPSDPDALSKKDNIGTSIGFHSGAVKRTHNGLAKAIGNGGSESFQETTTTNNKNNNKQWLGSSENVIFHEQDFDSDIDLDAEDTITTSTMNFHAKLSPSSSTKSVYPTLQKAALHTDAAHNSSAPVETYHPPNSLPLPWSSSPDYHKTTPPGASRIASQFLYNNSNNDHSSKGLKDKTRPGLTIQEREPEEQQPPPSPIRATKRRTLPWLQQADKDTSLESNFQSNTAKSKVLPSTPRASSTSQTSNSSSYAWNTTASAFKEQQKQFRKANKKAIKVSLGNNEESAGDDENAIGSVVNKKKPKSKTKSVPRPCLSNEQQRVLDMVVDHGKSVFFTGSAGTGKSVLLREIISVLRTKYTRETDRVAITASTGLAACNIGGVTLHSFSGIGLGKEDVPELVKKIKRNQKARHRWMRTKVLIIDEVSMVDGELFDKLEAIARQIRSNGRPFGGIQLVITGDFFQLPPVPDGGSGRVAKFSFDAQSWGAAIQHTIGLTHVFRQRDPQFASMLNEMREGRLSQISVNAFQKLYRPLEFKDDLTATELFPTRSEVEAANNARMQSLSGNLVTFEAKDGGTIVDKAARDKLLQNCMAPERLDLKVGAQVMLIKNIDEMLVNGSLGYVKGFMNEQMFDSYNADEDTYNAAESNADEDLNPKELKMKKHIQHLQATTTQAWPLVRFTLADGTTRDLLCNREIWKVELPNGEVQASRAQVPLILAWALSIHKAQGQTLERVKVDLGKVFEKGQAYVALSRATTMEGLQVLRFDPKKVIAHEKVRTFYAGLSSAASQAHDDGI